MQTICATSLLFNMASFHQPLQQQSLFFSVQKLEKTRERGEKKSNKKGGNEKPKLL